MHFVLLVGEEKILCFNLLVDQATDNVTINVEENVSYDNIKYIFFFGLIKESMV